jgi:hypothetical protein
MRRFLFSLACLISIGALLCWAAGISWQAPFFSDQHRNWMGSEFRVVMGGAAQDEGRLRIGAVGDERTALQSVALNGVDAAENPILRYRFEQFPHTLELSLVFRRMGSEDVSVVSLPWPGGEDAWFDLGSVPEWKGRITEIAFAEYPTPQIVPPMQGFQPFTLVDASLSSRSWHGDLAALRTDWLVVCGHWRHSATESCTPDMNGRSRSFLGRSDIVATARELKSALRDLPGNSRILVHSIQLLRATSCLSPAAARRGGARTATAANADAPLPSDPSRRV